MLTWLIDYLEQRRTHAAIVAMVEGLLQTTDDWVLKTELVGSIFQIRHTFTSDALKVTIGWTRDLGLIADYNVDFTLTLDGEKQELPKEVSEKLDKAVERTLKRIAKIEADRARCAAEHKLASWVVKNQNRIRRAELVAEYGDEPPAPKVLRLAAN